MTPHRLHMPIVAHQVDPTHMRMHSNFVVANDPGDGDNLAARGLTDRPLAMRNLGRETNPYCICQDFLRYSWPIARACALQILRTALEQ
jgi:hypothetical protein